MCNCSRNRAKALSSIKLWLMYLPQILRSRRGVLPPIERRTFSPSCLNCRHFVHEKTCFQSDKKKFNTAYFYTHARTVTSAVRQEGIQQGQGGDKSRQWEIWLVTCHWPCQLHHDDPLHLLFVCVPRLHRRDRQMTVCLWNANTQTGRGRERDSQVVEFQLVLNLSCAFSVKKLLF